MNDALIKYHLTAAFALLILTIIAFFHLKPGSPSFIVNIIALILLLTFILVVVLFSRRVMKTTRLLPTDNNTSYNLINW